MSVVKVQGNASGTGIFTIAAPATNTDRTLTLPDQTGTVLTNAGPFTASSSASAGAVTIDASNNVGIGTSSPSVKLQVTGGSTGTLAVQSTGTSGSYPSSGAGMEFVAGSGSAQDSIISYNRTSSAWRDLYLQANTLLFGTAGSERARIDSSGNLLVGTTTTGYTDSRLVLSLDNSTKWVTGPGAGIATRFYVSASNSGGVYLNGTAATSWTAISDERFKTDLLPIENAATKVASLRAVTGVLKSDEAKTRKAFLMAQDVLAVLPEAVDTTNPDQLGLAYTEVIPLLVAAIQEQQATIESLTARIAALEGTSNGGTE